MLGKANIFCGRKQNFIVFGMIVSLVGIIYICFSCNKIDISQVNMSPPTNELSPSDDFKLIIDNRDVFVNTSRVFNWRNPDGMDHGIRYSTASFASFNCTKPTRVVVRCKETPNKVTLRPLSYNLVPELDSNTISFTISPGQKVTVEPFSDVDPVLHIFADKPEENIPNPNDQNVLYFGPGIHETAGIVLKSGQILYLAEGAILKGITRPDDKPYGIDLGHGKYKLTEYLPIISAKDVKDITICGKGIVDGRALADQGVRKPPVYIQECENVKIEGITIVEGTAWNITLENSENCIIDGIKIISHFYNSDGINPVSSKNVIIRNCFLRQQDDGIAVKSMGNGESSNIHVSGLVMWSDWGFALGITYEIREPVHDIVFEDCDIINATHANDAQGVLGILVSDKSTVSNVVFRNIRVERALKPLIELTVLSTQWSSSEHLGGIQDITFDNIVLSQGGPIPIRVNTAFRTDIQSEVAKPIVLQANEKKGFIRDVTFKDVSIHGLKLDAKIDIQSNGNIRNIDVQ